MQTICADYKKVNSEAGTVVAIGNFDGVHKGHKKLLCILKDKAKEKGVPSVVYTFLEHPKNVMSEIGQKLLYTNEMKEKLIADTGVHTLFFEDFLAVKNLEPEEFVSEVLVNKFNIKAAVIGATGRFGKCSQGDAVFLKELGKHYGFEVLVVEPVATDGIVCSSTEVRNAISQGDFEKCEKILGRPYSIKGTVIGDKHLGRTYGYPTANIIPNERCVTIKCGVYATNTRVDGITYKSITNVGSTSFDNPEKLRIETHIIDFSKDLYGREITVEFLYHMRGFKNFTNTEELKLQLDEDKKERKLGGR